MRLQPRSATFLVVIGALLLSSVSVRAIDYLANNRQGEVVACSSGEVLVVMKSGTLCVDQYEASPVADCAFPAPLTQDDTVINIAQSCGVTSVAGVLPWRFVSQIEAKQICAQSGKRLPTPGEWYELALATQSVESCIEDLGTGEVALTGSRQCVTAHKIHDLVGNLWEWTDAVVVDGVYNSRTLPQSGYIAALDGDGVVTTTASTSLDQFGADYAWVEPLGTMGVLRGGFFGSGSDGGVFAQNISTKTTAATQGIGFRCVRDITSS